jgi:hypothetical protein
MDYLVWILQRQSRFSGAEKLSRIALQLHHEILELDEQNCVVQRDIYLSFALTKVDMTKAGIYRVCYRYS